MIRLKMVLFSAHEVAIIAPPRILRRRGPRFEYRKNFMPVYGAVQPVKASGVLTAVVPPGVTVIEPMVPNAGVTPVHDATPFRL